MSNGSEQRHGRQLPIALTIAGFDPSGGAGVLADSRTFTALGCRAAAVITSITFQNSELVLGAANQSANVVRDQLLPLLKELPASLKTGMLPTREVVVEVAGLIREHGLPSPVVDPVIQSSSGHLLMEEDALEVLISDLFPLARLVTPNIPEAERLTGRLIDSVDSMREAAASMRKMGASAVLVKGGHLAGNRQLTESVDILDDNGTVTEFQGERIPTVDLHGTGCILSAAIAAGLAKGMSLQVSVGVAKQFVLQAIREAGNRAS